MMNTDSPNFSKCAYSYEGPLGVIVTKKSNGLFEGLIYDNISVNDKPFFKSPFSLSWRLDEYWLSEPNDLYEIIKH